MAKTVKVELLVPRVCMVGGSQAIGDVIEVSTGEAKRMKAAGQAVAVIAEKTRAARKTRGATKTGGDTKTGDDTTAGDDATAGDDTAAAG